MSMHAFIWLVAVLWLFERGGPTDVAGRELRRRRRAKLNTKLNPRNSPDAFQWGVE